METYVRSTALRQGGHKVGFVAQLSGASTSLLFTGAYARVVGIRFSRVGDVPM